VRLGAFSIYLPGVLKPRARALTQALAAREAPDWRPSLSGLSALPQPRPSARALAAYGLRAVRAAAVPVEQLERLDELLRAGAKQNGGVVLSDQARDELGWRDDEARTILKGLGFAAVKRPGEAATWRRRGDREFAVEHRPIHAPNSPFAALAALQGEPAPVRRPRRRRRVVQGRP
jgi:ATP-dependent RNA helicase SUPV3L1/SUV3